MKNLKMIRTLIQLSNGALTGTCIVSIVKSSTPVSKKRKHNVKKGKKVRTSVN